MTEEPANRDLSTTVTALSLRGKLLLFAAGLILIPGLCFGLLAQHSGRVSLQRVIGHQLAREAGHTAERLVALLETERQVLEGFARQDVMREVRVADIDKRVSSALTTLRHGSAVRLDYFVVDRDRRVVAASNPRLLGPLPAWAARFDQWRGPTMIPGYPGMALLLATPVPDPDGGAQSIGTLVGLYDWQGLTGALGRVRDDLLRVGLSVEAFVTHGDGRILAATPSSPAADAPSTTRWSDITGGDAHGAPDYVVDREAGLLVGRATLGEGFPDWRLLIVEPLAEALAPARRLTTRLTAALAITLAAALAVAAWAAGRVARPLSELTHAIRALARGEAASPRVAVQTQDEVGVLAATFNRMAAELDRAQRDLVEAAKFAFAGELAAGVAHEVRTSLGVLRSSAQMLERSLPDAAESEGGELAQLIRAEVDRLGRVVDDLLNLSRPRALQLRDTPLALPVFRAVEFIDPQARAQGVQVERLASDADPVARCDVELIYQVALNLLVNALQALDSGGRITAGILPQRDGYVGFEIRDDGPGIPEELRDKVLLPFVTGREGGVGLGLTFVQRVVHEHRGRLSLETAVGAGTCFRVELPAAEGQP